MRRVLFITEFATVTKQGERLILRSAGKRWGVPVRYLDMLIVSGKVTLSGDAINLLLRESVPVFFVSRFYKLRGALIDGLQGRRSPKRLKQFEAYRTRRLDIAKEIVKKKAEAVGRTFRVDVSPEIKQLEKAGTLQEIMGVEGSVSKKMFDRFGKNIKDCGLSFEGRTYHPPKDEVNALLSLTYTLCYCATLPLVIFAGYDPFVSFLHSGRGNHFSLCSDLLEPVRPFVTKLIEEPLIREVFKKRDFSSEGNGCYLRREALEKFLNWFEANKEKVLSEIKSSVLFLEEVL
jgi:CRISPR-associated protein Cas1